MAADPPLERIALGAVSVADDLGYVALADISQALAANAEDYRIIGGHMVTALAARWNLGAALYRETGDADVGVPPLVARNLDFVGQLTALGYRQVAGDRFERPMSDIPIAFVGIPDFGSYSAAIDILVPAYTNRPRHNVKVGTQLVTTEVPGLGVALARAPLNLQLELRRLNGETMTVRLPFPDEANALAIKGFATTVRSKPTDVVDVWRCLEICFAAEVDRAEFDHGMRSRSADIIRQLFDHRLGAGVATLISEQHLSAEAADRRFTRIRALIARVLGPE